jgi:hypothetical protein
VWPGPAIAEPYLWLFLTNLPKNNILHLGKGRVRSPLLSSKSNPLHFWGITDAREFSRSCMVTMDLAPHSMSFVRSTDNWLWKEAEEAIPPMPVPIPTVIPNPINKGMTWIVLFDRVWAIKSMGEGLIVRHYVYQGGEEC